MLYLVAKKSIDKISLDFSYFICNESWKNKLLLFFLEKNFGQWANEQSRCS